MRTYILFVRSHIFIIEIGWCSSSTTQGCIKRKRKKSLKSIINPSNFTHIGRNEKRRRKSMPFTSNTDDRTCPEVSNQQFTKLMWLPQSKCKVKKSYKRCKFSHHFQRLHDIPNAYKSVRELNTH